MIMVVLFSELPFFFCLYLLTFVCAFCLMFLQRPKVAYPLQIESGKGYELNRSLFERLVLKYVVCMELVMCWLLLVFWFSTYHL